MSRGSEHARTQIGGPGSQTEPRGGARGGGRGLQIFLHVLSTSLGAEIILVRVGRPPALVLEAS